MNWKPALAGGIVVALLGIGAGLLIDGGGGGETTTTVVQTDTPTDEAPETTTTDDTTTTEDETTPDTETTTPDTTSPLASREATIAEVPMRIDILQLARQGEFVTLNFSVTNLSREDSDVFYRSFDDTTNGTAADGLLLIDPSSGTEYRVIRNPEEGCLCSDEIPFTLDRHQSANLFATFDAPPASTSTVNVSFPGSAGTITDVPISG